MDEGKRGDSLARQELAWIIMTVGGGKRQWNFAKYFATDRRYVM